MFLVQELQHNIICNMATKNKTYTNDEITVFWKPELCIHSRVCFTSLGKVFNPNKRPWIKMDGAGSEEIMNTVSKCPSGALSYQKNNHPLPEEIEQQSDLKVAKNTLSVVANGPLKYSGECVVIDQSGREIYKKGEFFLCRCGASLNKPFCDGSHLTIKFQG